MADMVKKKLFLFHVIIPCLKSLALVFLCWETWDRKTLLLLQNNFFVLFMLLVPVQDDSGKENRTRESKNAPFFVPFLCAV